MNVRLESMCHGDGKVYLQMVIDKIHLDSAVLLEARLKSGRRIPAHLFPFHPQEAASSANYVVVLPHFDVREVDLAFVEYTGQGTPLSQSRLTIELNNVRWKTRLNTLVKNELTAQMFDIEREYCADRMNIYFTDAIEDGDEVVVKMLADMPHQEGSDIMVDFLDLGGEQLDLPIYPLVDEVVPAARFGDGDRLHVGFSVRVLATDADFCVTVYDGSEQVPGGFALFCEETHEPLRESFSFCSTDAARDAGYADWYQRHCETLAGLALQRKAHFEYEPLVSLVVPVRAGDECYLPAAMRALRQQTYGRFEIVVADAGVSEATYNAVVREWEGDGRLMHIVLEPESDDASVRLTGVLQSAGAAVAVLDPSIILAPEALFEYVRRVNEVRLVQAPESDPEGEGVEIAGSVSPCDVVYANHDVYDRARGFCEPAFKPVYSPDLLCSYDYMGPLVFFSRDVVDMVAADCGFAVEAFDYDLLLKACSRAERIEHIDQVLYHVQAASSFSSEVARIRSERAEAAFRGGRKAVANQLRRAGVDAVVLANAELQSYDVQYRLPEDAPSVTVVIPSKNQVGLLDTCIQALLDRNYSCEFSIVVVDNASDDPETLRYYDELQREHSLVRVVSFEGPFNQAEMINAAATVCDSDYLLLMDNDTEMITQEGIAILLAHCCREGVGVVGAKMLFPDDTIQHAGMTVGPYGSAANIGVNLPRSAVGYGRRFACSQNLSAVSGACMMVCRSVFDEVGGFDKRFLVSCYDVDFCCKVRAAGYLVAYNGSVELYHQENATTGHVLNAKQRLRAERERAFLHYRWPRYFVEGDPYMSAGFSKDAPYYLLGE